LLSILYGIASAATWGAGDFAGGLASRKLGAYRAVMYADFFGLLLVGIVFVFYRESIPSLPVLVTSAIAGALGSVGLLILYYSLTQGQMSIAAPVSALFAAVLPVVVGAITEGLPKPLQFIGFAIALTSVWLISSGNQTERFRLAHLADLRLPILAGIGFGSYFVFIHYAVQGTAAILWPMIASRMAGTFLLLVVVLLRREPFAVAQDAWGVVALNATLDLAGNLFYILASHTGRLDIAAVLSSLYPGSTVLLAWFFLKERIAPTQWIGIAAALLAIVLFTL